MVIEMIRVENLVWAKNEVFKIMNMSENRKISIKKRPYLNPYGYFVIDS